MAIVNVKARGIAAADGAPLLKGDLFTSPRRVYRWPATVEVTNGDSIGSVYRFSRVPSNAVPAALIKKSDAIASAVADFGLYRTAADGGAVVDADFFGSAVALTGADTTGTDIVHESGVVDISEVEQPLWQLLGLTADPGIEYDIAATLTVAATGSGTLTTAFSFTLGN